MKPKMRKLVTVCCLTSVVASGWAMSPASAHEGPAGPKIRSEHREGHGPRHPRPRKMARKMAKAIRGEVTEVAAGSFTIKTRRGDLVVALGEDTKFRRGTKGDLVKGVRVAVLPDCPSDERRKRRRSCVSATDGRHSVKARAVLFPPSRSLRKDALSPGESSFSA